MFPSFLFAGMQDVRSGCCKATDEKRETDTVTRESDKRNRQIDKEIFNDRRREREGHNEVWDNKM